MKKTCYNNGKVKIGSEAYLNKLVNPPYVETDNDMLDEVIKIAKPLSEEYIEAFWERETQLRKAQEK